MQAIDEMVVKYPFLPSAREKLNAYPLDDETVKMLHDPIMSQAFHRLDSAIKRLRLGENMQSVRDFRYESYRTRTKDTGPNSDVIDFYSYFTAVFGAKDEPYLMNALARTEATRAKSFFVTENPANVVSILREMINLELTLLPDEVTVTIPVMNYLQVSTRYDLNKKGDRFKLVNLPLDSGIVYCSINTMKDLFAAVVQGFMLSGMRSLRRSPIPDFIRPLVDELRPQIPVRPASSRGQYQYVERLLQRKITDGRHRVIWLILAPYFVTVKGMDEGSAIEAVLSYIGDTKYRQFISYNVKRAVRNGLLPPTEASLRSKHPDIVQVLPKDVIQYEAIKRKQK
jgi:Primase X